MTMISERPVEVLCVKYDFFYNIVSLVLTFESSARQYPK